MNSDIFSLSIETVNEVKSLIDKNKLEDAKKILDQYGLFMQAANILNIMIEEK